jgi:hypothetical protein
MITVDKPYNGHRNSKSAKIRKLLLSEEAKSMTVDEVAKRMKVVPQRVYAARASLRKAGLLPPARAEVTGIASLPHGTIKTPEYVAPILNDTITIPEYNKPPTPEQRAEAMRLFDIAENKLASLPVGKDETGASLTPEQLFKVAQGRQGTYSAHLDPIEAAEAASRVQDGVIERKYLKQSFLAIAALSVFLAAFLIYNYA